MYVFRIDCYIYMCCYVCYNELFVILVFPTIWVFSVELDGLVIPKFRINHFITKSQPMCCVLCTYVFKRNVDIYKYQIQKLRSY